MTALWQNKAIPCTNSFRDKQLSVLLSCMTNLIAHNKWKMDSQTVQWYAW